MSRNIFTIPAELYQDDLPPGYECNIYIGRMTGSLKPMKSNPNFVEFAFEIHDTYDPTEMVLHYTTLEAPAQELARWENAGDIVGIVIAYKGRHMFMVMAYNFSRRKWFGTGYYPHVKDKRPLSQMSIRDSHNLVLLSVGLILTCVGIIFLPIGIYANAIKSQQYRILNPTDYRGVTAKRIADWITANSARLAQSGGSSTALDPSL